MLDTDVLIHFRDRDPWVRAQVLALDRPLLISAITRIELENGVWRDPAWAGVRRTALDLVLTQVTTLGFADKEIAAYQAIIAAAVFSKRKMADRMTAATAVAHGFPLVTLNGRDFRDVPALDLIEWVRPEE